MVWHSTSGLVANLRLDNGLYTGQGGYQSKILNSNWRLCGTGDIDGDGVEDLLWHNQGSGKVAYWLMGESSVPRAEGLLTEQTLNAQWRLAPLGL